MCAVTTFQRLLGSPGSASESLRVQSASSAFLTLEKALEDAHKYDEARELRRKRDAEANKKRWALAGAR